jgi:putative SOS response-associated peptidase YedK
VPRRQVVRNTESESVDARASSPSTGRSAWGQMCSGLLRPPRSSRSSCRSTHGPRPCPARRCFGTPSDAIVASSWRTASTSGGRTTDAEGRRSFIRLRSGRPFGFAGIWSMRPGEKGARLATCAIATCPPNELMAKIHDGMPVILPEDARDRWLDPTAGEPELRGLLVPLPAEDLEAYAVSALVNSPRNDSPECVKR